jgi:hypothetical protein
LSCPGLNFERNLNAGFAEKSYWAVEISIGKRNFGQDGIVQDSTVA